jgi:hypothetical protein
MLMMIYHQATPNGMTFVRQIDCQSAGLPWVNMYNKASYPVVPSMYSVQAAMIEFSAAYNAGNLTLDIVDAPGNESWPLAYMTFILLNQSITTSDCTNIQELLRCPHCPITPPIFGTTLICSCSLATTGGWLGRRLTTRTCAPPSPLPL